MRALSVEAARAKIAAALRPLPLETRTPLAALGARLQKEVLSPSDSPRFDNSAMDGYAMRAADGLKPRRLIVEATLPAGRPALRKLKAGQAFRVFTGAPLPPGADCVVAQEKVRVEGGLVFPQELPGPGSHIRRRGEELKKGQRILDRGQRLHSRAVGALCALGVEKVHVRRRPKVAVFVTGSELVARIRDAGPGKIFDANSPMLLAAARECRARVVMSGRLKDSLGAITHALKKGLAASDLLLVAGGVSVGDYDHVKAAFKKAGVREIFWRVNQKPGKPLFFGTQGRKLVFGLPGNPAAAWTCFHEYVRPALEKLQGEDAPAPGWARLERSVNNDGPRVGFLKAALRGGRVRPLEGQGSHMLGSLARADAFLVAPAHRAMKRGGKVEVHLLAGGGA